MNRKIAAGTEAVLEAAFSSPPEAVSEEPVIGSCWSKSSRVQEAQT